MVSEGPSTVSKGILNDDVTKKRMKNVELNLENYVIYYCYNLYIIIYAYIVNIIV